MADTQEVRPGAIGTDPADGVGDGADTSIRRYPVAYASLYAPTGQRTRWWAAIRCPHCGGVHLARLRGRSDLPGVRRSGCGRLVWIAVARTYGAEGAR